MTAEVAILNKSAIALAADSAVTISVGESTEKTFDSADKLFELCRFNPIGVMVYNGLSFAEVPLQTIVKQFRSECEEFDTVKEAASQFLIYLNGFGKKAPARVKDDSIKRIARPSLEGVLKRYTERVQKIIFGAGNSGVPDIPATVHETLDESISFYEDIYNRQEDAQFIGGDIALPDRARDVLTAFVGSMFTNANFRDEQRARIVEIALLSLRKNVLTDSRTGIVVAGFGNSEIFPTLISFEIDGMVGDQLKFVETNNVDIDRSGPRARVIPFAQKDMMDRFMYGMDDGIESNITKFCDRTVPAVRKAIMDRIEFQDDADRNEFEAAIIGAEQSFVEGLGTVAFAEIRSQSRLAVEAMVEFMPKPELAKMAEALVNLTSIKRRVSRGMETVGGPIDVAVISQAEGFVWVKRKHYFPPEINGRYFERVRQRTQEDQEHRHAKAAKSRGTRKGRGKAQATSAGEVVGRAPEGSESHPERNAPIVVDGQSA